MRGGNRTEVKERTQITSNLFGQSNNFPKPKGKVELYYLYSKKMFSFSDNFDFFQEDERAGQADVDDSDAGQVGDDNYPGQAGDGNYPGQNPNDDTAPKIAQDKDSKGTQALEEALSGFPPR